MPVTAPFFHKAVGSKPLYGYVIEGTENERIEGLAPEADALKKEIIKTFNQIFKAQRPLRGNLIKAQTTGRFATILIKD